jgi:hypothetical protein
VKVRTIRQKTYYRQPNEVQSKKKINPAGASFEETLSEPSATELTQMQYFGMYFNQNIFLLLSQQFILYPEN